MAEGGAIPKAPKSNFSHLNELAQRNNFQIKDKYEQKEGQFVCTLEFTGENISADSKCVEGKGSSKSAAKDNASEEALTVLGQKFKTYKADKNPVSKLNELCQKLQLRPNFEETGKSGNEFTCILTIYFGDVNGDKCEKYNGKGRSKREAKIDAASVALHDSNIWNKDLEVVADDDVVGLTYARSPKQTGYVLIINFRTNRDWVEQDETNIQDFFKDKLNFRCTLLRDSTKDELLEKLDKTKSELNENAAQYYCFILFLMGHGTQFGVNTIEQDKKKRTISPEDIVEYFKNEKMPNFVGKPKAFFIQSCRGSDHQETYIQSDDVNVPEQIRVPRDGDIFIAYSTTEGNKSYRIKHIGSIFIYNMIKIFERFYKNKHLEEMMIDVKATVALKSDWRKPNTNFAQMPCTWSTLTKRLQFYEMDTVDKI